MTGGVKGKPGCPKIFSKSHGLGALLVQEVRVKGDLQRQGLHERLLLRPLRDWPARLVAVILVVVIAPATTQQDLVRCWNSVCFVCHIFVHVDHPRILNVIASKEKGIHTCKATSGMRPKARAWPHCWGCGSGVHANATGR